MLLETPGAKSDLPVIMKVRGLSGIIEPRFFADPRRWKCTEVFALDRSQIAKVDVRFYDDPLRSFSVEKKGSNYTVKHMDQLMQGIDTNMAVRYLNNYKKIHFELVNYEFSKRQVDSLKKAQPFCILTMKQTNGTTEKFKMYRMKGTGDKQVSDFGDNVDYDVNRFWCILPSGDLVKCQYFVFNPLLMGHIYFDQTGEIGNNDKDLQKKPAGRK
jgi:hypothetical protein